MVQRILSKEKDDVDGDSGRATLAVMPDLGSVVDGTAVEGEPRDGASAELNFPLTQEDKHECLGEIVISNEVEPSELMRMYELLKKTLSGDILCVTPGRKGTSIFCAISDVPSFLWNLQSVPRVT